MWIVMIFFLRSARSNAISKVNRYNQILWMNHRIIKHFLFCDNFWLLFCFFFLLSSLCNYYFFAIKMRSNIFRSRYGFNCVNLFYYYLLSFAHWTTGLAFWFWLNGNNVFIYCDDKIEITLYHTAYEWLLAMHESARGPDTHKMIFKWYWTPLRHQHWNSQSNMNDQWPTKTKRKKKQDPFTSN